MELSVPSSSFVDELSTRVEGTPNSRPEFNVTEPFRDSLLQAKKVKGAEKHGISSNESGKKSLGNSATRNERVPKPGVTRVSQSRSDPTCPYSLSSQHLLEEDDLTSLLTTGNDITSVSSGSPSNTNSPSRFPEIRVLHADPTSHGTGPHQGTMNTKLPAFPNVVEAELMRQQELSMFGDLVRHYERLEQSYGHPLPFHTVRVRPQTSSDMKFSVLPVAVTSELADHSSTWNHPSRRKVSHIASEPIIERDVPSTASTVAPDKKVIDGSVAVNVLSSTRKNLIEQKPTQKNNSFSLSVIDDQVPLQRTYVPEPINSLRSTPETVHLLNSTPPISGLDNGRKPITPSTHQGLNSTQVSALSEPSIPERTQPSSLEITSTVPRRTLTSSHDSVNATKPGIRTNPVDTPADEKIQHIFDEKCTIVPIPSTAPLVPQQPQSALLATLSGSHHMKLNPSPSTEANVVHKKTITSSTTNQTASLFVTNPVDSHVQVGKGTNPVLEHQVEPTTRQLHTSNPPVPSNAPTATPYGYFTPCEGGALLSLSDSVAGTDLQPHAANEIQPTKLCLSRSRSPEDEPLAVPHRHTATGKGARSGALRALAKQDPSDSIAVDLVSMASCESNEPVLTMDNVQLPSVSDITNTIHENELPVPQSTSVDMQHVERSTIPERKVSVSLEVMERNQADSKIPFGDLASTTFDPARSINWMIVSWRRITVAVVLILLCIAIIIIVALVA